MSEEALIRAAFLRYVQEKNQCEQTGKPCESECACFRVVVGAIERDREAKL